MKPICVPCQRFFRPQKTGYYFIEGMPKENDALPGTLQPDMWQPYKLWSGDLWECQGCGTTVIVGSGKNPVSEHYQADFAKTVELLHADFQVNDC